MFGRKVKIVILTFSPELHRDKVTMRMCQPTRDRNATAWMRGAPEQQHGGSLLVNVNGRGTGKKLKTVVYHNYICLLSEVSR